MPEEIKDAKTAEESSATAPIEDVQTKVPESSTEAAPVAKEEPKTLAEVVAKAAAESKGTKATESTPDAKSVAVQNVNTDPKAEAAKGEVKKEEVDPSKQQPVKDEELPFHKHPRWQKVIAENKQLREAKPLAEEAQSVRTYRQQHQISDEQFSQGMTFLAKLNTDPKGAIEMLKGTLETLQVSQGMALPADLQAKVTDGTLPEDIAKELAQARVNVQRGTRQSQDSATQAQQAAVQGMTSAVNVWEQSRRSSDPDYAPKKDGEPDGKYEFVESKFLQLASAKPPKSAQEAVALVEQAYGEVSKSLQRFVPKPAPTKVLNSNASSTTAKKEPTTMREAMAQAAAKHGLISA